MPEYNIQLRGWHAVVALAALLAFLGISMALLRVRPVDDEMRAAVHERLLDEYSGREPKDIARMVEEARAGARVEPAQPRISRDVEFPSMAAHGKMGASVTLIRAEITAEGGPPADGRPIRYFRISRKFGGGWTVVGESNAYNYYSDLLP